MELFARKCHEYLQRVCWLLRKDWTSTGQTKNNYIDMNPASQKPALISSWISAKSRVQWCDASPLRTFYGILR